VSRQPLHLICRIVPVVLGVMLVTADAALAQTWRWYHVLHVANEPPVNAQATVDVAANEISWSYTAPLQGRQIIIASCRAASSDVQQTSAYVNGGQVYFLIRLKPNRTASCDSGRKEIAAIPGDDYGEIRRIAAAVNGALSGGHASPTATSRPTPEPRAASPSPHAAPSESASPRGTPAPVPDVPPRLLTRGTSSLAIGHGGVARVRVTIAADGSPEEASIVSVTDRRLAAAALEIAASSTYAPATKNGKPLSAPYVATFSISGEDPATSSIPVWRRSPLPAPMPTETPSPSPTPTPTPAPTPTATPTPAPTPTPTATPRPTPEPGSPLLKRLRKPTPTPTPTPVL